MNRVVMEFDKFLHGQFIKGIILCLLIFAGCKPAAQIPVIVEPPIVNIKQPLRISGDSSLPCFQGLYSRLVFRYYKDRHGLPVWMDENDSLARRDSMLSVIRNAQYYGLPSHRYHVAELDQLAADESQEALIRKELLLTDALLRIMDDVQLGVQSTRVNENDSLRTKLLNDVFETGQISQLLARVEPVFKDYHLLKRALRQSIDSLKLTPGDLRIQSQIRLISINLERWRQDAHDFGDRYILVNIPSYMLSLVENDSVILTSKVIVGKPGTETPVLSSVVECFTLYPYWHVPRKISVNEYLQVIQRDTTFIRRNNFDVLDRKGNVLNPDSVEWHKFHENYFPVVLRQREGPDNSLGLVKFTFDNPYAVFLHDTNAKRLFNYSDRAFSHGCIRMEKAIALAHYLATGVLGKESKQVIHYLKEKKRHYVDVRRPVPIFVRYYTCEFRDNKFFAYKDVYGKDDMLYALLYGDTGDIW